MKIAILRSLTLLLFGTGAVPLLAESWSGILVDAPCLAAAEQNHNVSDSLAVQDVNMDIRLCRPGSRTRVFGIVRPDNDVLVFDSAGNSRCADWIRKTPRKSPYRVMVDGEIRNKRVAIASIALLP